MNNTIKTNRSELIRRFSKKACIHSSKNERRTVLINNVHVNFLCFKDVPSALFQLNNAVVPFPDLTCKSCGRLFGSVANFCNKSSANDKSLKTASGNLKMGRHAGESIVSSLDHGGRQTEDTHVSNNIVT